MERTYDLSSKNINNSVSALQRYLCKILTIQGIRWKSVGNIKLPNVTIFYSYGQTHEYEVRFIVNNMLLFVWNLQLECKWGDITVINFHAPPEDKEELTKEEFYNQVERVYDCILTKTRKIIIDLNKKISKEKVFKLHEIYKYNRNNLTHLWCQKM